MVQQMVKVRWLGRVPNGKTVSTISVMGHKVVICLDGANWVAHLDPDNELIQTAIATSMDEANDPRDPKLLVLHTEKLTVQNAKMLIAEAQDGEMTNRISQCTDMDDLKVFIRAARSINQLDIVAHAEAKLRELEEHGIPEELDSVVEVPAPAPKKPAAKARKSAKKVGREPYPSDEHVEGAEVDLEGDL